MKNPITKNRCYNGGKLHKFRGRYSERPYPGNPEIEAPLSTIRSLIYYKVYIYDICSWCGKIKTNLPKRNIK